MKSICVLIFVQATFLLARAQTNPPSPRTVIENAINNLIASGTLRPTVANIQTELQARLDRLVGLNNILTANADLFDGLSFVLNNGPDSGLTLTLAQLQERYRNIIQTSNTIINNIANPITVNFIQQRIDERVAALRTRPNVNNNRNNFGLLFS